MEIRDGTADAFQVVWEVFGGAVEASSARIAVEYWDGPAGVAIRISSTKAKARPVTVIADQLPQIQVWVGPDAPDLDHELWGDDTAANLAELRAMLLAVRAGRYERAGQAFESEPY